MIGLVCIDVDGTLVGSAGVVYAENWAAAERARARGIRLALCSGRPGFGVTAGFAERLDATGWHIFQNGASVVFLPTGETRSAPIPRAAVEFLIARSRATGRVLEIYSDTGYAVESNLERARRHAGLLGLAYTPRDLDSFAETVVRAQWVLPHSEAEAVLAEPHEGLSITPSGSPVMPDTTFLNITAAGVDKGSALERVAAAYGVPLQQVMMVGDSGNDLPAMRVAGVSVAMGNAEHEIHAVAHHIVGDVDRGGLVEALALAQTL